MRSLLVTILLVLVGALGALAQTKGAPKPEGRIAQADALYAKRDDLTNVREGVRLLAAEHTTSPASFEAAWKLAKQCYFLGAHTADKKERGATFDMGQAAAEAAIKLKPARPEGHFWRGANIGGRAKAGGKLGALDAVGDVRKEMDAVIKADPGYQNGSAYLILGQIDLEVPGLFGGSKKRAVQLLEKGLTFGDQNALLRLRLAQAYLAVSRKDDARKLLDGILSMKPHPDYVPEYKEAAAEAKTVLDKNF